MVDKLYIPHSETLGSSDKTSSDKTQVILKNYI